LSEGIGSTFWFVIELEKAPEGQQPVPTAPADIRHLRLLVVDDNATNRLVVQEQFGSFGLPTEVSVDGETALQALRAANAARRPVHLAILDHHMPGMDGLQLARAIKADPGLANTVLLLLSSATDSDPETFRAAGFSGWATKPVGALDLLASIVEAYACSVSRSPDDVTRSSFAESEPANGSEETWAGLHILLVEDNEIGREAAQEVLRQAGCTCDTAENGFRAVEAVLDHPYDLILMDCQMPEMDGFEATRVIREHEQEGKLPGSRLRRLPIVALTAFALKGDRDRCLEAGMDDYVTKPIDPERLMQVIGTHVAAAQVRQEETACCPAADPPLERPSSPTVEPSPFDAGSLFKRWGSNRSLIERLVTQFGQQAPGDLRWRRTWREALS